jgi:hypothetical protein
VEADEGIAMLAIEMLPAEHGDLRPDSGYRLSL